MKAARAWAISRMQPKRTTVEKGRASEYRFSGMGNQVAAPDSGPPASGIRRVRLLLVDANDETRAALRHGLEAIFDVVEASSAKEALTCLRKRWFRIIVADYQLPDHDGVWLLDRVAQRSPYTWRVLMSAWSVPRVRSLRDAGVLQLFMAKPIQPDHLSGYFVSSA